MNIFPTEYATPKTLAELRELSRQHGSLIPTVKAGVRLALCFLSGTKP